MRRAPAPCLLLALSLAAGAARGQEQPSEPKPAESQPAETPPAEPKPSEPKPPQPGGAEARPAEAGPAEPGAEPGAGPADDEGPVIVGRPRETWKSFDLTQLNATIEFRYQYQNDKLKQSGQADQTFRETRYRELLDLSTQAAIGHKNLVEINGTVQLGLEDIDTRSSVDNVDGHERDFVSLYDLSVLLFGASELPTTVYLTRDESTLDRPFASTITETRTEEGIATSYSNDWSNTNIRFFHRADELKDNLGAINTKTDQYTFNLQNGLRLSERQRLETYYNFDDLSESQSGGYQDAYSRHDGNIVHTLTFGDESRPHELRSSVRVYDQGGLQSQRRLRWDEVLNLRHTDRLETRYSFSADQQTVRGESQDQMRGEASVKHRLFDSLTSFAAVGGQHLSAPGGFSSDELYINVSEDYTKRTSNGRLDASVGGSYNAQSNSERGSTLAVANESYTYRDGFPVLITRRNIVAASVVVTPVGGFPVYQEGVDYTLQVFVDHAEIRGVLGGALVDGQTILVSYDVGPEGASDVTTTTGSASVRYSFQEGTLEGLALYATLRTVGHSVSAADPSIYVLDDLTDVLLGVEYRFAEFTLKYEYNNHDSTFDPYTVHRWQGLYDLPLGRRTSINAEWTRELIEFTSRDDRVTFDRGAFRWNYRANPNLDLNARLEYRNEDSTVTGETQGFDQSVGFTYHRRQTTFFGAVRNSIVDGPASEQTTQFLQLGVRRIF